MLQSWSILLILTVLPEAQREVGTDQGKIPKFTDLTVMGTGQLGKLYTVPVPMCRGRLPPAFRHFLTQKPLVSASRGISRLTLVLWHIHAEA